MLIQNISLAEINQLYKASEETGRAGPGDTLVGLRHNRQLLCAARLLNYDGYCLLRNLCTLPDYRSQGLASQLLQAIQYVDHNDRDIFALPLPHLNDFYIRNHYFPLSDNDIPAPLTAVLQQSRRRHKGIRMMVSRPYLR